jgi:non-ribosomal peptide synthetase component F
MTDKSRLDYLKGFSSIILGGETLDTTLVNELKSVTDAEIYNIYGPTEATVWVTYAKIEDVENITIGKPMANTQIHIVDKYMNLVPIGVQGELCIAGDCVTKGYLNRDELTNEKFTDNPFGEGKLYRTGDIAYRDNDGNIVFVGRNDFQVKIRGLRIELGEIENAVSSVDGIIMSVAVVREDKQGRQFICVFYTGDEVSSKEIKEQISGKLPKYMIPHVFTHIDEMPLT